jgi:transposase
MASRQFLTDEQWAILAPLIPPPVGRDDGRGSERPVILSPRPELVASIELSMRLRAVLKAKSGLGTSDQTVIGNCLGKKASQS